jgi:hypothetical protein
MKLKDAPIAFVWIVTLAEAFSGAIKTGHAHNPVGTVEPFPPVMAWFVILPLFFVLCSVGVFVVNRLVRRRLLESGGAVHLRIPIWYEWLEYLIDRKWGAGTCREFFCASGFLNS